MATEDVLAVMPEITHLQFCGVLISSSSAHFQADLEKFYELLQTETPQVQRAGAAMLSAQLSGIYEIAQRIILSPNKNKGAH